MYSPTKMKTLWILFSGVIKKPLNLDLHCFPKRICIIQVSKRVTLELVGILIINSQVLLTMKV